MPTGPRSCVPGIRHTLSLGVTVGLAGGLLLGGAVPAQATHTPDGEDPSTPTMPSYPAPGQPISVPEPDEADDDGGDTTVEKADGDLRVATLNAGLTGGSPESVLEALRGGMNSAARVVARTAHLNAPDVMVLTGVTHDADGMIAETLNARYLAPAGLDFPYVYTAPTNSGIDSGTDLDGDGRIGGPGDALGYGEFPGQHGIVIFSAHPIVEDEVRTFQDLLWSDIPDNSLPDADYSDLDKSVLRLASTSLWDVPVEVGEEGETLHVIANGQAPEENARGFDAERALDERRMIADYVSADPADSWYIQDDAGESGGLTPGSSFVIAGEPGSVPGEGDPTALDAERGEDRELPLLDSPAVQDPLPEAVTERELSARPGSEDGTDPHATRAVEGEEDRRVSLVLPDAEAEVTDSGVFWPGEGEFGFDLVDPQAGASLRDRLVWVDLGIS
ncbi:endonuclease/exonuclease/phosphatase family protein [Nesterenkonia xinjiangensis]|uniref:3-phytase n=1 Tax=Nesterenkonia xinjiangensis TaxID=225327 RepID=A0A7Z0GLM9_9MICC|nr:endonuclease/exonuclease/phosphatase family protein [Nesterenkonia xinjiangensis]NYJ78287.1 3-phytase [Nesterenkonia xinjiangensis]